jgi:hypothetical protein
MNGAKYILPWECYLLKRFLEKKYVLDFYNLTFSSQAVGLKKFLHYNNFNDHAAAKMFYRVQMSAV